MGQEKLPARDRILECSRTLFSEHSFDKVSLRDIARQAEVSVALIVKHFQNKEHLFAETIDFATSSAALFSGPFAELGRTAVTETLTAPSTAHYSIARAISVANGQPGSLEAIGNRIKTDILQVLAQRIADEAPNPNPKPELRAQAVMSMLVGLSVMRRFGDTDFDSYAFAELVSYYGAQVQDILNGDPSLSG